MRVAAYLRRTHALILAVLIAAPAACASASDELRVTARPATEPLPKIEALALRIENEDDAERIRLSAIANAMISRHGIRPDSLAPLVLVLNIQRPRRLSSDPKPTIGIEGRVGSSSQGSVGIIIGLPWSGPSDKPEPEPHVVRAKIERISTDALLWQGEARVGALPSEKMDSTVAERLINALLDALDQERKKTPEKKSQ